MVTPLHVLGQENAKVAFVGDLFMDSVAEGVVEAGLAVDAEDVTLAGVELEAHPPGIRPRLELLQVLLQRNVVIERVDFSIQQAVVCGPGR